MVAVIRQEKYKFSYGRKWTLDNMNKTKINLPIQHNSDGTLFIDADKKYSDDGYVPDWQFMEDYMKSLHHKPLTTKNTVGNALALKVDEWEEFRVDDLFSVQLSKGDIKLNDMLIGDVPLVSSGETNNGVVGYIDSAGDGKAEIFSKNKITVDMFGNVYYQEENFYAVSHGRVNILEPVFDMTKYIGLFIVSIINKEKFKYSYGRAVYSNVLCNVIIKLPIQHNADGTTYIDPDCTYSEEGYVPDWNYVPQMFKEVPRDASAAAIAASAFLELSNYIEGGEKYAQAAERILQTLSSPAYLAEKGTNCNFILKHSVGSIPHGQEIDVPLVYADYYYLEALLRYNSKQ